MSPFLMCSSVNINRTSTFLHPSIFPSSQTWFLNTFTSNTDESGNQLTQLLQAVGAHPCPNFVCGGLTFCAEKGPEIQRSKDDQRFCLWPRPTQLVVLDGASKDAQNPSFTLFLNFFIRYIYLSIPLLSPYSQIVYDYEQNICEQGDGNVAMVSTRDGAN